MASSKKVEDKHGETKEEDEEVDLIDPVVELRAHCGEKPECKKLEERLQACNERVRSKSKTTESCHEEMIDWLHELDHCVAHSLFNKLK